MGTFLPTIILDRGIETLLNRLTIYESTMKLYTLVWQEIKQLKAYFKYVAVLFITLFT